MKWKVVRGGFVLTGSNKSERKQLEALARVLEAKPVGGKEDGTIAFNWKGDKSTLEVTK